MARRTSRASLGFSHPELLKFWNFGKNLGMSPEDFVAGSAKKADWICSLGHQFESEIRRQAEKFSCPYCSGHRVFLGFNDLATVRPDIAAEWDFEMNAPVLPTEVTSGAKMKAHWKCKEGHTFQTQVAIRKRGVGCGYCAGQKVWTGFNDIASKFPRLVEEWDFEQNQGLKPEEVLAGGNTKRDWLCTEGHKFKQSMVYRLAGAGCPYCAGRKILPGWNDLETLFPELAKEWNYQANSPVTPADVTAGSGRKVAWICPEGHPFIASIANRRRTGCPVCVGQTVLVGVNDLASVNPELAEEWDFGKNAPLTPSQVTAKSGRKVHWQCSLGHSWAVAINVRKSCPFCSGRRVVVGETDLASINPSLAGEWDYVENSPLEPSQIAIRSHHKVGWICPKGHKYKAVVSSRANGTSCPYCAGVRILPGFNDLATVRPDLAAEWDYSKNGEVTPDKVALNSMSSAHWLCPKGHPYQTLIAYRADGGCPICGGKKTIEGLNDLATKTPRLAAEWDYQRNARLTPAEVTAFSGKKVFWLCEEGHSYTSAVYARQNGNACPQCATSGYNPAMAGLFYFISNRSLNARKLGITNPERKTDRLARYGSDWEVLGTWYSKDGEQIRKLETQMLRWIRKDNGLPVYLGKIDMGKNGGHSETFGLEGPSDLDVFEQVESVINEMGIQIRQFDWVRRVEA
jgi:hypothetical protein